MGLQFLHAAPSPHVLFVQSCPGKGGSEHHVVEAFKLQYQLNNGSHILVARGSWLDHELNRLQLPHSTTNADFFSKYLRPLHTPVLRAKLKKLMQKYSFDVIHCNNSYELAAAKDAAKGFKTKIFYTHHVIAPLSKKRALKHLKGIDTAIGAGPGAEMHLRNANDQYNLGIKHITFIPPFIDASKYLNTPLPVPDTDLRSYTSKPLSIFMAAQFYKNPRMKGHDILLQALAEVKRHGYSFNLKLAGDGVGKSKIESLCKSLGLSENVTFLGFRSDIINLIDQADVIVLPSAKDCFPLALLEAGARGKALIGDEAGGASIIIENGKTGFTFKSEDASDLAEKIKYFIKHPDERLRMGLASRERIVKKFKSTDLFMRVNRLYAAFN